MSTVLCPNGHQSTSTDYCDVCGSPIEAAAAPASAPTPAVAATTTTCPHCGAPASSLALFCETCGYDFTTGSLPAAADPAPVVATTAPSAVVTPAPDPDPATEPPAALPTPAPDGQESWVAEIWVDPDWYAAQQPEDPMPSAGLPGLVPLRERSVLVGRPSVS
ncbi:MAG: zinc ribbon domain-containing protein, partial [Cellulomonas sp.]